MLEGVLLEAEVHGRLVAVGLSMGCRHKVIVHGFICNIAVMAETLLEVKWDICHEVFWKGYWALKEVRNSKGGFWPWCHFPFDG